MTSLPAGLLDPPPVSCWWKSAVGRGLPVWEADQPPTQSVPAIWPALSSWRFVRFESLPDPARVALVAFGAAYAAFWLGVVLLAAWYRLRLVLAR